MKITVNQAVTIGVKIFDRCVNRIFCIQSNGRERKELAQKGNMLTAFTIGAGQTYLALMAGQIAFWIC